jgi:hypothetical protein
MSENQQVDPGGNTAQFRAYAQSQDPAPTKRSPVGLIVGIAVAVVVVAVVVWIAFS